MCLREPSQHLLCRRTTTVDPAEYAPPTRVPAAHLTGQGRVAATNAETIAIEIPLIARCHNSLVSAVPLLGRVTDLGLGVTPETTVAGEHLNAGIATDSSFGGCSISL